MLVPQSSKTVYVSPRRREVIQAPTAPKKAARTSGVHPYMFFTSIRALMDMNPEDEDEDDDYAPMMVE